MSLRDIYTVLFVLALVEVDPVVLYQSYRGHRDLHSFPTRRSSDLVVEVQVEMDEILVRIDRAASELIGDHPDAAIARSEEHTSELQSRENLVCRLLLEKKKQDSVRPPWCPLQYSSDRTDHLSAREL